MNSASPDQGMPLSHRHRRKLLRLLLLFTAFFGVIFVVVNFFAPSSRSSLVMSGSPRWHTSSPPIFGASTTTILEKDSRMDPSPANSLLRRAVTKVGPT